MNHEVNPQPRYDNVEGYRAGYLAGRAAQRGGGGRKPPKKNSCPLTMLLLPYYLARHLIGGR